MDSWSRPSSFCTRNEKCALLSFHTYWFNTIKNHKIRDMNIISGFGMDEQSQQTGLVELWTTPFTTFWLVQTRNIYQDCTLNLLVCDSENACWRNWGILSRTPLIPADSSASAGPPESIPRRLLTACAWQLATTDERSLASQFESSPVYRTVSFFTVSSANTASSYNVEFEAPKMRQKHHGCIPIACLPNELTVNGLLGGYALGIQIWST